MQNVIIFGANRGIGLALTKKYISEGFQVWALCRSASSELKETQANVIENCDVTNIDQLKAAYKNLNETKFDIYIHNAGVWADENIFEATDDNFQNFTRAFEINSIAPLKTLSVFKDCLKPNAKVGLMSSRMGSVADNDSGGRYAYRMSKTALNMAGKSLSVDLNENPIAILHPGYVRTDMTGGNGLIDPDESAEDLYNVLSSLTLENSGKFWHSNGEVLPW